MNRQQIEKRVRKIANKILQEKQYVSYLDILLEIGWLQSVHMNNWRRGQIPYLESIQKFLLRYINQSITPDNRGGLIYLG